MNCPPNLRAVRGQFSVTEDEQEVVVAERKSARTSLSLSIAEVMKLEHIMDNPAANLSFETRKGGLYVRITEIKQEG